MSILVNKFVYSVSVVRSYEKSWESFKKLAVKDKERPKVKENEANKA
jgi:hypothetical protein